MLAYRHAFHAGSHADVLKHVVLVLVLRHMADKAKPYTLLDTHAGAGGYSLHSRYARTSGEFETGIARLIAARDLPPVLAEYVALVREFNGGGALEQYPGSPAFAQMLMRPNDRLRLYELHPTDHKILDAFIARRPNTQVALSDGFAALARELPPPSRRGVVLIDPSYEIKADYARVIGACREALQRFASGVLLVWHPQVQLLEAAQLPKRLIAAAQAAPRGWLHATLTVLPGGTEGYGMTGSGVFVVNPPWPLREQLAQALPALVQHLGRFDGARYVLDQTEDR